MALFPTDRVNAVPLQYEPTFADLAGRPVQAESRLPETPFLDLVTSFDFRSDMSTNAGVLAQTAHMQQQALIQEQVVRMAATRGNLPWRDAEALARPPAPGAPARIHEPAMRRDAGEAERAMMGAAEQHEAAIDQHRRTREVQDLIARNTARPVISLAEALEGRARAGLPGDVAPTRGREPDLEAGGVFLPPGMTRHGGPAGVVHGAPADMRFPAGHGSSVLPTSMAPPETHGQTLTPHTWGQAEPHGAASSTARESIPEHDITSRPSTRTRDTRTSRPANRPLLVAHFPDTDPAETEAAQTPEERNETQRERAAQEREARLARKEEERVRREELRLAGIQSGQSLLYSGGRSSSSSSSTWGDVPIMTDDNPVRTTAIVPAHLARPPAEHMAIMAASPNNPPISAPGTETSWGLGAGLGTVASLGMLGGALGASGAVAPFIFGAGALAAGAGVVREGLNVRRASQQDSRMDQFEDQVQREIAAGNSRPAAEHFAARTLGFAPDGPQPSDWRQYMINSPDKELGWMHLLWRDPYIQPYVEEVMAGVPVPNLRSLTELYQRLDQPDVNPRAVTMAQVIKDKVMETRMNEFDRVVR